MSLPQPPTLPHCYRHPDREAGRSCTRCGKPACSSCLVQATVGSHCLECAKAARPDVKTRVKYANAKVLTPATFAIIGVNCLVFLWTALGGGADGILWGGGERTDQLGVSKLILQGDLYYSYLDRVAEPHEWYRMVTNGFVHFGLVHLAMNMWALYVLGGVLERTLGATRFSLLYLASLLGGTAGIVFIQPDSLGVHGGASGAVFGLMAAMVISLWRQGASIMNSSVGQVFMLNLVITFAGRSFISVGGHLGGAAVGALLGLVMLGKPWKPAPKWATYAAPVAGSVVAALAVVLAVA